MEGLYRPSTVRDILRRHGIRPRKSLGQNFLIDGNILARIVEAAAPGPADLVIEVGPGIGTLTRELCRRAGGVLAIERDRRMEPVLAETLADCPGLDLRFADAMAFDFADAIARHPGRVTFVSNLPYNIATPLLLELLLGVPGISLYVVMVQKELADRFTASPGGKDYGATTVKMLYRCSIERVISVPRTVFLPPPQVDSVVLRLTPHAAPPVDVPDEGAFLELVETAFAQRRKTLKNALSSGKESAGAREAVALALADAGIEPGRRAETLSLAEFAALARSQAKEDAPAHIRAKENAPRERGAS